MVLEFQEAVLSVHSTEISRPQARVLIVDDEPMVLKALEMIIRRLGGEASLADSGAAALAQLRIESFSLILADLYLRDMTGLDVFLRAGATGCHSPFALMTGLPTIDSAVEATKCGIHHYLEKPVTEPMLAGLLARLSPPRPSATHLLAESGKSSSPHIQKAIRMIERDYFNRSISVQSIAEAMAISADYLARQFKKCTGRSVLDFLHQERIRHAKKLLAESDASIKVVADLVGYHSTSELDRKFAQIMACSPSEFRKRLSMTGLDN